jgi:F0F1-type ATP synthase delta subunit
VVTLSAPDLAKLIRNTVFRFSDEAALQDGIEVLLQRHGLDYRREMILSPQDRIDFMVGDIGIEVKVASPLSSVQRQLFRYAKDQRVKSLILVTTRAMHKQCPEELLGKSVEVVHLLASIF